MSRTINRLNQPERQWQIIHLHDCAICLKRVKCVCVRVCTYLHPGVCADRVQSPKGGLSGEGVNFLAGNKKTAHLWDLLTRVVFEQNRSSMISLRQAACYIHSRAAIMAEGNQYKSFLMARPLTFFRWAPSQAFCSCVDGGGWPAGRQLPGLRSKLRLRRQ